MRPLAWSEHDDSDSEVSDSEIIAAIRSGDTTAYGSLYSRHLGAARRYAFQLARHPSDVDDLVSEAFTKVLNTLRTGGGPDAAFRTYLLRTVRNLAYDRTRRDRKLSLTDDLESIDPGVEFDDVVERDLDRSLAATAFKQLPPRWQAVLWHTAIEGQHPREVAAILGISPHNVAALAYRAREGLRQAYLGAYIQKAHEDCAGVTAKLGAVARGGASKSDRRLVADHVATCEQCQSALGEVKDIASTMRSVVAPVLLGGGGIAAGYIGHHHAASQLAAFASRLTPPPAKYLIGGGAAAAVAAVVIVAGHSNGGDIAEAQGPATGAAPSHIAVVPTEPSRPVATHPKTPTRPKTVERPKDKQPAWSAGSGSGAAPGTGGTGSGRTGSSSGGGAKAPAPPPVAAAPSLAVNLGGQGHQYDATSIPITSTLRGSGQGPLTLRLSFGPGIQLASAGSCSNSGSATAPVLNCGTMSAGQSRTTTIVVESVPNSDGTFYSASGNVAVNATAAGTSAGSNAATEVRCEGPYD